MTIAFDARYPLSFTGCLPVRDSIKLAQFFDDDGNPINGGCYFGSRCHYIHPSDSIWKTSWRDDSASSRTSRADRGRGKLSRKKRTRELSSGSSRSNLARNSTSKSSTPMVAGSMEPNTPTSRGLSSVSTVETPSTWDSASGWGTEGTSSSNPWRNSGWGNRVLEGSNENIGMEHGFLVYRTSQISLPPIKHNKTRRMEQMQPM